MKDSDYYKLDWSELPPSVRNMLPREAGPGLRMAAAKGVLPMGTVDLGLTLFHLKDDPDRNIAGAAQTSLTELPTPFVDLLLSSVVPPRVLDFFAHRDLEQPSLYERILLNPACENETVRFLAETLTDINLLEIIASNQTRLLRHPAIYRSLRKNRAVPRAIRDRVEQFLRLQHIDLEAPEPTPVAVTPEQPAPTGEPAEVPEDGVPKTTGVPEGAERYDESIFDSMDEEELKQHIDIDALAKETFERDDNFVKEFLVDPEKDLTAEERTSLTFKIKTMRVLDQLRLALKGSLEARIILIKSSNKIIQECVLSNPRITIDEVLKLAKDKTAREELIRVVCANREWVKNYAMKLALLNNPKTPIPMSLKMMNFLNDRDLAQLSKSKQIPGILAVAAKKALSERQRYK